MRNGKTRGRKTEEGKREREGKAVLLATLWEKQVHVHYVHGYSYILDVLLQEANVCLSDICTVRLNSGPETIRGIPFSPKRECQNKDVNIHVYVKQQYLMGRESE